MQITVLIRTIKTESGLWLRASVAGLAQIGFQQTPIAAILLLLAIAVVSPHAAIGGVFGAGLGALLARGFSPYSREELADGLASYNPAIVGMIWGGVLARGESQILLLPLVILLCVKIDYPIRSYLRSYGLPALSLAAICCAWLSMLTYSLFGADFWQPYPALLPMELSLLLACLLVFTAIFIGSIRTGSLVLLVTSLLVGLVYIGQLTNLQLLQALLAAVPAIMAFSYVFMSGSQNSWQTALAAALLALVFLLLWQLSPLQTTPAMLLPAMLAIWVCLLLLPNRMRFALVDPQFHAVLSRIRQTEGNLVVMTGAGVSTASGIPDYISGAWLNPDVPVSEYEFQRFRQSKKSRGHYWQACRDFLTLVKQARANVGHLALAKLERRGWVRSVITQNVDGLHQQAGNSKVTELHGSIHQIHCLQCGTKSEWHQIRQEESECQHCGGLQKPAVIAMGEDIPAHTWLQAQSEVQQAGFLLVLGSQLAVSSAVALLAEARRRQIGIAYVNLGPLVLLPHSGEVVINLPVEEVLPALALILGKPESNKKSVAKIMPVDAVEA